MSRRMLPESVWRDIGDAIVVLDGDAAAFVRVTRRAFPGLALAFVHGGSS